MVSEFDKCHHVVRNENVWQRKRVSLREIDSAGNFSTSRHLEWFFSETFRKSHMKSIKVPSIFYSPVATREERAQTLETLLTKFRDGNPVPKRETGDT